MYRTDDPVRDAERYSAAVERWMDTRPICECCGLPITEEKAYRIDDKLYCPDCVMEVDTDDYCD